MKNRTFQELKESKSTREFNKFCMKVAKRYANPNDLVSKRVISEEYSITESCCSKVLDYAVTHWLVSEKEINYMMKRAVSNQQANSTSSGFSSERHYSALRKERGKYLFDLAQEYATMYETPVSELIEKHGRDAKGYFFMLSRALLQGEQYGVPFELAKQIHIRAISDCTCKAECARVSNYFYRIWQS